ncbi:MAG: cobyric acid synthase CobQ, partial [Vicinamibacteraceae bacterium]
DAEDSLAVERRPRRAAPPGAALAIVSLPRTSNATDFRLLDWADWLTAPPADSRGYDFVVLPGTKDTLGDLAWLQRQGLADWVRSQHAAGATIVGVCGGYQMLGERIADPDAIESIGGTADGLGLLPVRTVLAAEKRTRVVRATLPGGASCAAYEIHLGVTTAPAGVAPFAVLADGSTDGARGTRVLGTYLHGAFEDAAICAEVFGVPVAPAATKAAEHQALAEWFEASAEHVDAWLA